MEAPKIKYSCTLCGASFSWDARTPKHLDKCEQCKRGPLNQEYIQPEADETTLSLLEDPKLFDRIDAELDTGIAGESKARRAILLSACSIWTSNTELHTLINSESSAGKSYLCKQIYKLLPTPNKDYQTRISPAAFTYWHNSTFEPWWNWDGKLLYLEDISQTILDSDVFKVMCSEGSKATIVIKQRSYEIEIKGKPCMMVTTASTYPKSEILNRFNIINLDESEEQTRRVFEKTNLLRAKGKKPKYDQELTNALYCLKRKNVVIPEHLAKQISNSFPATEVRSRRDYPRFLDLWETAAALYQHQRECYPDEDDEHMIIEANREDYKMAREAFLSMNTSGFGLVHQQAKAFEACKKWIEENPAPHTDTNLITEDNQPQNNGTTHGFTVKEISAYCPRLGNDDTWLRHLDRLAQRGLLSVGLQEKEGKGRKARVYKPVVINYANFLPMVLE